MRSPSRSPRPEAVGARRATRQRLASMEEALKSGKSRAELLASHLARMERELDRTRAAVSSLRRLLQPEPAPLDGLAGGERQRSERAPVERAEERDDPLPLRVIARQLDGRLVGFGTAVIRARTKLSGS